MTPEEADEIAAALRPQIEAERKMLLHMVKGDLRNEIHELLADIHYEAGTLRPSSDPDPTAVVTAKLATFYGALAIKSDRQTRRIVWLTWGLLLLTAVLALQQCHYEAEHRREHQNVIKYQPTIPY